MWAHYYQRWGSMTMEELGAPMIDLVPQLAAFAPPAKVFDKHVNLKKLAERLEALAEA